MDTKKKKIIVTAVIAGAVLLTAALIIWGKMRHNEETPLAVTDTTDVFDGMMADTVNYSDTYVYKSIFADDGDGLDEDGNQLFTTPPPEEAAAPVLSAAEIDTTPWVVPGHFTDAAWAGDSTDTEGGAFEYKIKAKAPFEVFPDSDNRLVFLYADAFNHWLQIDSAIADSAGMFSFNGKAPGTGLYMIAVEGKSYGYVDINNSTPFFIFPLDSNIVYITADVNVYSKHPDINKWDGLFPLLMDNASINRMIFHGGTGVPTDPKELAEFEAATEAGNITRDNEVKKAIYAMAPSMSVILGLKYSSLQINHPRHEFFFKKKLIPKLKQGGLSAKRIAALEAEVNMPWKE
ncbi:MAG: hypothetical protein V4543_17300 [Bacteroidota bacterium]